ncbi:methylhydantoinase [Bradyrhizobium sp. NAS96.2]|nr:methylhydantoinase [Bradyrhizobium sp. NAS96.2]
MRTARIGVDVGGTFTDFVFHDGHRGITRTAKLLTTHEKPGRAIIEGIHRLLRETRTEARQIRSIVHGTTLITNTVLERTGARVGLIGTKGMTDVLEMGRETRYDVNNLFQPPIPVIVPRQRRRGVPGRILADGSEWQPLDERVLEREVEYLVREQEIEALAIAFMNAYRNPAHELRALEIVRGLFPNLLVTISSAVAPEIREYERTNTACVNAYVQPRVHDYLESLAGDLLAIGFEGDLLIMLSGGGLTTLDEAKRFPVRLIESGPAAGAMAASYFARHAKEHNVISFDMGGTTAKLCLIEHGRPHVRHDFEAGRLERFKPGSGLPLKVTVVDMIEIGSGGGSIASVNAMGLMKVGPRSAASFPGPVAYGQGGTEPTVTDADLLLGYLDPEFFLGGEMELHLDAARSAMSGKLAHPLGISVDRAARGIQSIVNDSMAAAARMHLAERGKDPQKYTMLAFGGAGPVHAYGLAKLLKVPRVIVPMGAGVISAFGFLVTAPAVEESRSYLVRLDRVDWEHVNRLFLEMERRARSLLDSGESDPGALQIEWQADMRYIGQGFEITVTLPPGPLGSEHMDDIRRRFNTTYAALFDHVAEGVPVEVVSWRLNASRSPQELSLAYSSVESPPERGERIVDFPGFGPLSATVYDRYALKCGDVVQGPAIFEERETTFTIGPDCVASVDAKANLVVDISYETVAT